MPKPVKILIIIVGSSFFIYGALNDMEENSARQDEYYSQLPDGMEVKSKWLCDKVFSPLGDFPPKTVGECRGTESFCKNTKSDSILGKCRDMGW